MFSKNKESNGIVDSKIQSAISVLLEKLTYSGIDLKGKSIIIKDGKLTIK